MKSLANIGQRLNQLVAQPAQPSDAAELLTLGEEALEHWVRAKGKEPTQDLREGYRLLALHRQGADKDPSFNACRETCRELVYHYNLLTMEPEHPGFSAAGPYDAPGSQPPVSVHQRQNGVPGIG